MNVLKMDSMVEDLVNAIIAARETYYNDDYSSSLAISDEEYDALIDQLREFDPNHKLLKDVGTKPTSSWPKVKHDIPMGSLDKVQNNTDWIVWWNKLGIGFNDVVVTEKLDGISIELQYEKGKFVRAITRGDGETGEDITPNVKKMKNVPLKANVGTVSVRGEILLPNADWQKYMPDKKNPRNAASGTSKRLDGTGCEHLSVVCYDIVPTNTQNYSETLEILDNNKFTTPVYDVVPCQDVTECVENMFSNRVNLPYNIDGAVVRIDNNQVFNNLGNLNLNPKGAVAYKPPPEMKATVVKGVTWQVGKTGRVTPVAELKPVDIGGTTISRVSLHTARMAVELGAGPEAQVLISRRNDVIPYVEKVISASKVTAPTHCPLCHEALNEDGDYLQCSNGSCPAVLHSAVKVWTERLDVLHWGDSFIERIIDTGWVKSLPDIYKLTPKSLANVVGDGIAERAVESLNKNGRKMKLAQFITALNIRHCQTTSKDLVSAGYNTIDKFLSLNEDSLSAIPGVGPVKAAFIARGITQLTNVIHELVKHVSIEEVKMGSMSGTSFCFTGEASRPRKELIAMAESVGAEVKSSVSKGLTYLVLADPNSTSTKAEKARKLGTKCISEEAFVEMMP